ncbi:DUF4153 domain-containing protein [Bradyrhizobium sp.]|uniref:DUF4153 domain-containing protein n=1 Tax=Bradyrhizobium sp. TaxID=376 RepID=UPI004037B6D8
MNNPAQPETVAAPVRTNVIAIRFAAAAGLAALADWLFYEEHVGISLVIFAIVLAGCALLTNLASLDRGRLLPAGLVLIAGLAPAIEDLNAISLSFVLLALGVAAAMLTNPGFDSLADRARALRELYLFAPLRLTRDGIDALDLPRISSGIAVWIVPVLMSCVFLLLFASANPLIEKWMSAGNLAKLTANLSLPRILFWGLALSLIWPFVWLRWHRTQAKVTTSEPVIGVTEFLSTATVLRSLILFNLLFAVQTALDIVYLWGNAALPADITFAGYAHRGAYPLILTALLAAGFVLVAMRPGGPAEQSKVIRPLVYLWVAQNVMLVISSILRLDLYVQTYLLTYWRIAAFIWMLLVATGLVLIVARIALQRGNAWLIRLNLIAALSTLYACSLTNFAAIISDYNVSHSREMTGKGVDADINYLLSLGPQAVPGINKMPRIHEGELTLVSRRDSLVDRFQRETASWRAWGLRDWRLKRYLDGQEKRAPG